MQPKTPKLLEDIRDAAAFVAQVTRDISEDDYGRNRMLRQSIERNFEIIGESMRRLTQHDPATAHEQSYLAPIAWTPAGILATRLSWGDAPPKDLLLIDPTTGAMRTLRPGDYWGAAVSDDGARLAITTGNIGFGVTQPEMSLSVIATNTGRETVLISRAKQVLSLVGWSPDGARLAYHASDATQAATLHVVTSDGSNRQSLTVPMDGAAGQLMDTQWRDGSTLVLLTTLARESRVYHAPLNAFTLAGLKQIGSVAGGFETTPRLVYVPQQ